MATLFDRDVSTAPAGPSGSLLTRKWGPLPVWAWGGIGVGLAIIYRAYAGSKDAAQQETSTTDFGGTTTPPTVYQDYITITNPIITNPDEPPGQGRGEPPQTTTPPATPTPSTPRPGKPPIRFPGPTPTHGGQKGTGRWVTVAKWTAKNAPWNSTISGIAAHYNIKNWQSVWNLPQNASLRARRKQPNLIQPNDRVWVPA
jgi:hypothetical protein